MNYKTFIIFIYLTYLNVHERETKKFVLLCEIYKCNRSD